MDGDVYAKCALQSLVESKRMCLATPPTQTWHEARQERSSYSNSKTPNQKLVSQSFVVVVVARMLIVVEITVADLTELVDIEFMIELVKKTSQVSLKVQRFTPELQSLQLIPSSEPMTGISDMPPDFNHSGKNQE